jgi:hypothetical protein
MKSHRGMSMIALGMLAGIGAVSNTTLALADEPIRADAPRERTKVHKHEREIARRRRQREKIEARRAASSPNPAAPEA